MASVYRPTEQGFAQEIADLRRRVATLERMPSGLQSLATQHLAPIPACRVWNSAVQTIPNITATSLTFDNEYYDTTGAHSTVSNTHRLTATVSGVYTAGYMVGIALGGGTEREGAITVNGGGLNTLRYAQFLEHPPSVTLPTRWTLNADLFLRAGDWVEFWAYQDSGGNLNTEFFANILRTEGWLHWVSNV